METQSEMSLPSSAQEQSSGALDRSWFISLGLGLLAILVYWGVDFEFRSDDVALMVQGAETSTLGGILRVFSRPFAEISSVSFYRPLFSVDFMLMGKIFGDDPQPIGLISLLLHGLAVILGHRSLLALKFPPAAAILAGLLFATSPWTVNNVAWLVGRSTTIATITILAVFILDHRSLTLGRSHSKAAILILFLGVFYRETSAMVLVLIGLQYLNEGLSARVMLRRFLWLSLPILLHFALRFLVIGAFLGGYAGLDLLRSGVAVEKDYTSLLPSVLLRLVGSPPGDASLANDARVYGLAFLSVAAMLWGLVSRSSARRSALLLMAFAVVHAVPLLLVEPSLHAGSSQRWHTVLWALTAVMGLGFSRLPRRSGWVFAAVVIVLSGMRLRDNLYDYHRSAKCLRSLRQAIERSAEPVILVHGMVPYVGCAPFFEIGVGQLLQPPFGDGSKCLFPLSMVAAHGPDARRMQTPLAAYFRQQDERFSPIWLDVEHEQVVDMPEAELIQSATLFESRKRLNLRSPQSPSSSLFVDVDVAGVERLEIHFIAPLAEFVLHRRRGEGHFSRELRQYQEDLSALREIGLHLDGQARGRAFLWIAAYDDLLALKEPMAVSEVIELRLEDESPLKGASDSR